MRRWHQDKKSRARIEIIPMIDVMMFLLVFFVLISIDVMPAFGIKIQLPLSSSAETSVERYSAIVSLGQGGELKLNGVDVAAEELVSHLTAIKQNHPLVSVFVSGDRTVELQRVIDVMDRIKAAGFQAMSISTRKQTTQKLAAP